MLRNRQIVDIGYEKIGFLRLVVLIALYTPIALLLVISSPFHLIRILAEKIITK
ncbi:MAG: hypothetical protein IPJ75_13860 [Ignavibacteriales bacterium]|nr:hypothetical protein [Ignavibacteriales bacterium]